MDKYFNGQYLTRSTRLENWDYGSNGKYFVTICLKNHQAFFGHIDDGAVLLNELGMYTRQCWEEIPSHHPFIELDTFIIMPDHIHGILIISKDSNKVHTPNKFGPQSQNLGAVIRDFKAAVTRYARKQLVIFQWQPRFYDRIIRNDNELEKTREYILNNPYRQNINDNSDK